MINGSWSGGGPALAARLLGGLVLVVPPVAIAAGPEASGEAEALSEDFLCDRDLVPAEAVADGQPATELSSTGVAGLSGRGVPHSVRLPEWTIVQDTETRVVVIREREPHPADRHTDGRHTHERVGVQAVPDDDGSGQVWQFYGADACELRRDVRPLNAVHLRLDDAARPDSRRLHLVASETECAGGIPSQHRVRLLSVAETVDAVRLIVGIAPAQEGFQCTGNVPAQVTVDLAEPLGDREVIDDTVHPPRVLTG